VDLNVDAVMPIASPDTAAPDGAPLHGIRVLDLGQFIAAPGAAMALAELGAEVIKIEPPGGERARHMGAYGEAILRSYNRGKRSVAIDLGHPLGRDLVLRLAGRCDVVVQNQRPGAVERLGLGPEQMRASYPRLIYLSISGFGSRGPSRRRAGFDIAAQAESGLMSITGEPDRLPQKVGAPIVDSVCAHLGAQAVLAALFRRERTGQGATIETSLLEAAMHLQLPSFTDYLATGVEPKRTGDTQPKNAPASDMIPTRDGQVVISAYIDEHWRRLCAAIGRPALGDDPAFSTNDRRVRNRGAMREALAGALGALSTRECVALLADAGIVVGAVRGYADVVASDDVRASGLLVEAPGAQGDRCLTLGLPYSIDDAPRHAGTAPGDPGADTDAVLGEAGIDAAGRDALRRAGAIA
jgi:crotonobetainyl-CoA:carnitine CoA-transferase CaiB-like acyl-CoA transferase